MKMVRFIHNYELLKKYKTEYPDIDVIFYSDIIYISGEGFYSYKVSGGQLNLKSIKNANVGRFSGINSIYAPLVKGIVYYFNLLGKKVVDKRLNYMLSDDKLSQIIFLDINHFSIPKSIFFYINDKYIENLISLIEDKIKYPVIVKDITKDRGEGVFKFDSKNDLLKFMKVNINRGFLFQEYIQSSCDYRVIIVGDEVLGGFKRFSNNFKHNFSLGANIEKVELPKYIKDVSLKISKGFLVDIAGIDFFIFGDKYYVIEINRLPQTNAFNKLYGNIFNERIKNFFRIIGDNYY